jgi:hypothetical protein
MAKAEQDQKLGDRREVPRRSRARRDRHRNKHSRRATTDDDVITSIFNLRLSDWDHT